MTFCNTTGIWSLCNKPPFTSPTPYPGLFLFCCFIHIIVKIFPGTQRIVQYYSVERSDSSEWGSSVFFEVQKTHHLTLITPLSKDSTLPLWPAPGLMKYIVFKNDTKIAAGLWSYSFYLIDICSTQPTLAQADPNLSTYYIIKTFPYEVQDRREFCNLQRSLPWHP